MFNTSLRIVNDRLDAEDVLQEAFTDAFLQLDRFANRSTFGAWLKQIVVYKSIGLLKKRKIRFLEMDATEEIPDEPAAEDNGYNLSRIREAIQELPDGYRTVLSLYLFEGYRHEEIADILGLAHSTVRTQYIRAKLKLMNHLKARAAHEQ